MFSKIILLLLFQLFSFSYSRIIKGIAPENCPVNEEPTNCLEYCLPTCDIPKRPVCTFVTCYGGCVCKEGYIRETEKGKCVPISSCVNPGDISRNYTAPCTKNEVLSHCVSCEAYCQFPEAPYCSMLWCPQGCICKEGFIRETEGGNCVPKESCKN